MYLKKFLSYLCFSWLLFIASAMLEAKPRAKIDKSTNKQFRCTNCCSYTEKKIHKNRRSAWLQLWQDLYEKNKLANVELQQEPRIPKIIHQIWLGSPLPEKYKKYSQSWHEYHPDWEYKLWTDEDVKNFPLHNQDLYNNAKNYGERSDILRYEILYTFGGLYVDTDFECFKPFDIFHHCYEFYAGIQSLGGKYAQIGIGLIGTIPGHSILKCCLERMKDCQNASTIPKRTGPHFFTKIFQEAIKNSEELNILFPSQYFYPLSFKHRRFPENKKKEAIQKESFAMHHWEASWLKSEANVK